MVGCYLNLLREGNFRHQPELADYRITEPIALQTEHVPSHALLFCHQLPADIPHDCLYLEEM